ncbi:hypothetical protein N8559_01450 [Gammaproteobacteria bacterium]|jgi:hypothetical protein|nr:hypothetical protein [Gammaproteobacteria bacterium]
MARGGSREGAGRKQVFTFEKKLALANEVTLRQQENPNLSNARALIQLEEEGLIRPQTRDRYLTPEHFNKEILATLREQQRAGILAILPKLSLDDPL